MKALAGDRRDYKFWANPAMMGLMPMASKVEVCYCDDNCANSFNFFKACDFGTSRDAVIDVEAVSPVGLVADAIQGCKEL